MLHTEFRDGNVPAGHEQLRVLKAALAMLPAGVERVRLRSDTAGYQQELLRYCAEGKNERFGRIEFAISCDVTREFRDAVEEVGERDWQPLLREINGEPVQTGQEWAEVCFVPNWVGHSKRGAAYRYLAIREPLRQLALPGMENRELPFPTVEMKRQRYKVFGIVTNLDWEGGRLIHWQHERCGKSEEVHQVMKEDLAGGTLPSADFGENAAWWWIMILAFNLNAALKRLVLGQEWAPKRMKAMRFGLIHLPGRVIAHARQLVVRLSQKCRAYDWIVEARAQLQQWALLPSARPTITTSSQLDPSLNMKTRTGVEKTHFRFVFRVSELETRFLSGLSAMQKSAMEPKNHGSLAHRPLRRDLPYDQTFHLLINPGPAVSSTRVGGF